MALIMTEGFDHYKDAAELVSLGWFGSQNNYLVAGQYGGYALHAQDISYITADTTKSIIPITGTAYFGARIRNLSGYLDICFRDITGRRQIGARFTPSSGFINPIYNDVVQAAIYMPQTFNVMGWNYIEIGGTAHSSSGTVILRMNGQTIFNLTGIQTQYTGTTNVLTSILITQQQGSYYIDDFYLCDSTTGPGTYPCNTFLGPIKITTLYPNGAGDSTQFTASSGNNYSCINEVANNQDTNYVYANVAGNSDLYTTPGGITSNSIVYAARVITSCRVDDASVHGVSTLIKSGGVLATDANVAVSSSYGYISNIHPVDPSGNSWSGANVNAAQIGLQLVS